MLPCTLAAYELLLSWILMLLVALTEEIAFRGFVLGHLLAAGVNRFVALFLSSALFSLMHIFNPNFSLIAFLNILLAGILIGSTYIYTRNLWFAIALHLFWNWLQGSDSRFRSKWRKIGRYFIVFRITGREYHQRRYIRFRRLHPVHRVDDYCYCDYSEISFKAIRLRSVSTLNTRTRTCW